MKNIHGLLLVGCSALALAGCGPSDIASPGTGGDVIIENPNPTPTPTNPTPTPGAPVTPAAGCPTAPAGAGTIVDAGTLTGPTGTYRICNLPSVIAASMTLEKIPGLIYAMPGRVNVGCDGGFAAPTAGAAFNTATPGCPTTRLTQDTNVTLTIKPGVIVIGATNQSWLAVNRGNKLEAVGDAAQPIIFTSLANVEGKVSSDSQGQWGGVVLMGRARTTGCTSGTVASDNCERQTEGVGTPALYGGKEANYDAGSMSYVQIRYSGFAFSADSELQALTPSGVGTDTELDHIMAFNSSDDGAEIFGGNVNMKYFISVGADDDSLDVDHGAQMNLQYALLLQNPGRGDALMEIDSNGQEGDTPRTKLAVANFTGVQRLTSTNNESNDQGAILLRGNSDSTWVNGIIVTPQNECLRMNASGTTPATLTASSVVLTCNTMKFIGTGNYTPAQVSTFFATGERNNSDAFTSTLTDGFINGSRENGVVATDPRSVSAFFDATTWIGAVRSPEDRWYAGWTCNSDTATFGSGNAGQCTSLPTT